MAAWRLWVDTGGTFTDALALGPDGRLERVKVLSSSALRGRVAARPAGLSAAWLGFSGLELPAGFAAGARFAVLGGATGEAAVRNSSPAALELDPPIVAPTGATFELRFPEEAPVLAARLLTGAASLAELPAMEVRLATTRGTNALLERKGARTAFFVTRGFGDLLRIGNQQRPELFAREIVRPAPLEAFTVEVPERLDAGGQPLLPLELEALAPELDALAAAGIETAAIALLHSYRNDAHEQRLAAHLRARGFTHVSPSAELSPTIEILPRAHTAVVDAYLSPLIAAYLDRVGILAAEPGSSLHVMSSAGGLVPAAAVRAKDTLLSGPAGGVVGAAAAGRAAGCPDILGFDMGGTSTDVCRAGGGDFDYTFEHQVGGARVAAAALRIETVAAGGGSICRAERGALKVGPESAGAAPGPAAYGAGGPLTLTDVNLLLGRLRPERFAIPIDREAAAAALAKVAEAVPGARPEELLLGFLEIANERMAEAMRRVSIRQGYDPAEHTLVAFGGAGGQHACALAELLGIPAILLPVDAGLLSARGLGEARLERFAQRQLLQPLAGSGVELAAVFAILAAEAAGRLAADGLAAGQIEIRRRLLFLRFLGQETAVEIELPPGEAAEDAIATLFRARFEQIYGYSPAERPVEAVAARVVASERPAPAPPPEPPAEASPHRPFAAQEAFFGGAFRQVPCYEFAASPGTTIAGPALLFDASASLALEPGWHATRTAAGHWLARRA